MLRTPPRQSPRSELEGAPPLLSFAELYRGYYDYTSRTLRHLGVPLDDIEDAAQEVWLAVHRQLYHFERRSSYRTWLFGIVVNVARNRRRARSRRPLQGPLPEGLSTREPDPELAYAGRAALGLVQTFLEPLEEDRRVLFVAHLLEDLDATEVAQLLGVEVRTVYHRVRALRSAFRRWFDERQRGASP